VDETIAAVATASSRSFRSIVRMSGKEALATAQSLIHSGPDPRHARGFAAPPVLLALERGFRVPARLLVMRAPYSYTTEDVVEFFLPGSPSLARTVLAACLRRGARLAGPGEFTRRAFVNGRIDAVQVEGVLSLIESVSEEQRAAAMERLCGKPTREAAAARARLLEVLAAIEAYVDFTDEDTEGLDAKELRAEIAACRRHLERARALIERRPALRDEPGIVILGPPNAGKSSLFDALVPGGSAIVSSVPGTTRDLIEGAIAHGGRAFHLFDAPGVLDTDDPLERLALANLEGMLDRIRGCLVLLDGSRPPDKRALSVLWSFRGDRPCVIALNKRDLGIDPDWEEWEFLARAHRISAREGEGLEELLDSLVRILPEPSGPEAEGMDVETAACMERAVQAMDRALGEDWIGGVELVAMEIREAFEALGAVARPVTGDELLDAVFARFCIGK
jgi:tRNA modification GTPase